MRRAGHVATWERKEKYKGFDGKARRKETTWKTKALMGGCDQNGFWGDWLEGGGVD
jgi:hypothetical protein